MYVFPSVFRRKNHSLEPVFGAKVAIFTKHAILMHIFFVHLSIPEKICV